MKQGDLIFLAFGRSLDDRRRATNANGRNRCIDCHLASFGNIPRDQDKQALHQRERCRIGRRSWIINQFINHHTGTLRKRETSFVNKGNQKCAARTSFKDIAHEDVAALFQQNPRTIDPGRPGFAIDNLRAPDRNTHRDIKLGILAISGRACEPFNNGSTDYSFTAIQTEVGQFGLRKIITDKKLLTVFAFDL